MLIDDLRATFLFEKLTEKQLRELARAGAEVSFAAGERIFGEGEPADALWVLLEGEVELARHVGGQRIVVEIMSRPGTYAGGIRAFAASGTSGGYRATGVTRRPTRFFQLPSPELGRLLDTWLPMAKHLLDGYVHTFEAIEVAVRERGRLISLGTLAAGLTHELNNPAAAARSAAGDLRAVVDRLGKQVGTFATGELTPAQIQTVLALHAEGLQAEAIGRSAGVPSRGAVETARLEEAIGTWLEDHGVANEWDLAPVFVAAGLDQAWLAKAEEALGGGGLSAGLNWVADALLATALVDQIEDATGRISRLVSAVKDYSAVDRAAVREVDIHEGIEKTLLILGYKLRTGVEVMRDYDPDPRPVLADGSELNQVWTNLIDNAIDAMGGHGQVRIRTWHDAHAALVEIGDEGPGIPAELASRIFDPFFTTKDVGKGTGLGLDIVRRIVVDRYHGEVTVDSKPGDTRVLVRLPVAGMG
jgi:signal transduction histidine kinase